MKEIEHDTNKWKDIMRSDIGGTHVVKMTILPKAIYKLNKIPIKIPMAYLNKEL